MMLPHDAAHERDVADRAEGVFLGAAVGDALGWPVEDRGGRVGGRRGLEPSLNFISWRRREGGRFQPHEESIEPGSYSDDTQLMLAVARSRLAGEQWWLKLTRSELPFWLLYERGGGGATKRAAASWARSTPPWEDKDADRYFEAGGNGVAMRVAAHCLPISVTSFAEVASSVVADGIATHGHPRALVGAVVQAYAVWRSLALRAVLGYGELIEDVLAADDWRSFAEHTTIDPGWEDLASRHFSRPYRDVWRDVVDEVEQLLLIARAGIGRGSLAVDRPVLEDLGCFGRSSGAGTVSAVSAVFLASRYAAQPAGGVVAAAFAKGADTDTLATLAGGILGAIHGTDWLTTVSGRLQDAKYVRALAHQVALDPNPPQGEDDLRPVTARSFWRDFGEPEPGAEIRLPGGRSGRVVATATHTAKREGLLPMSWIVATDDGQTLHLKRVKKVPTTSGASPADIGVPDQPPSDDVDRRPRIGVVLHVENLSRAEEFYREVVGLEVTKSSKERTVFAGSLALEPLSTSLARAQNEQLALGGIPAQPSFETTCALTIYVHKLDFVEVWKRIRDADCIVSNVVRKDGRSTFRCLDPDANVVEFRTMNGA